MKMRPSAMRGAPVIRRQLRIEHLAFPHLLAALGIDRDQAPVERSPDDLPLPHGDATIHDPTAKLHGPGAGTLRVVLPELLAGLRVERVDLAPGLVTKTRPSTTTGVAS